MSEGPVRHFHTQRGRPQIKLKADSCQKSNGSVIRGPLKGHAARSTYNNKQNFNKLKDNTMKQFAFIALFGAACALRTKALGGPDLQGGNPYKTDDPKNQEWEKCHKHGDQASCDILGEKTKKDEKKQGDECAKSPSGDYKKDIKALADKYTWGWIGIHDVPHITQFKGDKNTDWSKVDWSKIDWQFNGMVEQEWGNYFRNPEWGYVEYSVEADRFTGYLQELAAQSGKGDEQIWWLVGNMCTNLRARKERQDKPGYWDAYNDGSSEAWPSCNLN